MISCKKQDTPSRIAETEENEFVESQTHSQEPACHRTMTWVSHGPQVAAGVSLCNYELATGYHQWPQWFLGEIQLLLAAGLVVSQPFRAVM